MINTPRISLKEIGKNLIYTMALCLVLKSGVSFSATPYPEETHPNNPECVLDTVAIKNAYKKDIETSILNSKTFPINITYRKYVNDRNVELKKLWLRLRTEISFNESKQALVLTDKTDTVYLKFDVHPFKHENDSVYKLHIESFGFNPESNKFYMKWVLKFTTSGPTDNLSGLFKSFVAAAGISVAQKTDLNQKAIFLAMSPYIDCLWKIRWYFIEIPFNNPPHNNTADVTITVLSTKPKP